MSELHLPSLSLERNSVYALILTKSRLGLFPVIFRKFAAELWPLIEVDWDFYAHLDLLTCSIKSAEAGL